MEYVRDRSSENASAGATFAGGAIAGVLGGLIGLGGAEFRLPLLVSFFRFPPLEAIILNKATSLIVVAIAIVLLVGHDVTSAGTPLADGVLLLMTGLVAGFAIGVVASLLGVAGGELLIPTLVLLFSVDIKLAGSLSLAVSLPTMLVGFARYSRDKSFEVLQRRRAFVTWIAAGSITGALCGALLLGVIAASWLYPLLAVILLVSSIKAWRHQ